MGTEGDFGHETGSKTGMQFGMQLRVLSGQNEAISGKTVQAENGSNGENEECVISERIDRLAMKKPFQARCGKGLKSNEDAGARTQDLRIKSALLYQLSYVPDL